MVSVPEWATVATESALLVISKLPPEVVVNVPFTVNPPEAVFVSLVLLKVRLL